MATPPTLLTLRQFSERHPAFGLRRLERIRFGAKPVRRRVRGGRQVSVREGNGFAGAFVKVAGRVLVDEGVFFEIIENGRRGGDAS